MYPRTTVPWMFIPLDKDLLGQLSIGQMYQHLISCLDSNRTQRQVATDNFARVLSKNIVFSWPFFKINNRKIINIITDITLRLKKIGAIMHKEKFNSVTNTGVSLVIPPSFSPPHEGQVKWDPMSERQKLLFVFRGMKTTESARYFYDCSLCQAILSAMVLPPCFPWVFAHNLHSQDCWHRKWGWE